MRWADAILWCLLAVLSGSCSAVVAANNLADVGGTAELEERISALEQRVTEGEAESARVRALGVSSSDLPPVDESPTIHAHGAASHGCPVGYDFSCSRNRSCGLYGGGELLWLKPFASGINAIAIDAASANEFLPAWRLWGGYQNSDGLGWRVSWWQWDQFSYGGETNFLFPNETTDLRLVFQNLDLEISQMVSFRRWDLMMSGGVTYVRSASEFGTQSVANPADNELYASQFNGWGLTAGLLAIRNIQRFAGLSGYGGVQWSGVYGNSNFGYASNGVSAPGIALDNTMANILELRVGTLYERRLGNGIIGFLSGGFEAQYWAGIGDILFEETGIGDDLGLVGFTVGAGIRR